MGLNIEYIFIVFVLGSYSVLGSSVVVVVVVHIHYQVKKAPF